MSELSQSDASTRRDFIAGLTVGAAGLIAAGCAPGAPAQIAPAPASVSFIESKSGNFTMLRPSIWDDSWTGRLGKHRTVFDFSEMSDDGGAWMVLPIMDNYKEALGVTDADLGFVLIIRHAAMAYAVQDAMWDKYNLGTDLKEQDPQTTAPYKRNPLTRTLTECRKRGVTLLGCNVAMNGFSNRTARKAGGDAKAIKEELFANLVPGMILLPTGVYALARAQNVGCGYMT
jgi:hypothetical protein